MAAYSAGSRCFRRASRLAARWVAVVSEGDAEELWEISTQKVRSHFLRHFGHIGRCTRLVSSGKFVNFHTRGYATPASGRIAREPGQVRSTSKKNHTAVKAARNVLFQSFMQWEPQRSESVC